MVVSYWQPQEMERRLTRTPAHNKRAKRYTVCRSEKRRTYVVHSGIQMERQRHYLCRNTRSSRRTSHSAIPEPQHRRKRQHYIPNYLFKDKRLCGRSYGRASFHRTSVWRNRQERHRTRRDNPARGSRDIQTRKERYYRET